MPVFTFRALRREPDGILGPTLYEQRVEAPDKHVAVAVARAIDIDMEALGANAVYLTNEEGRAIWSLHAAPPQSRST
ncbi:hypothetical protein [Methylobacterium symbioticum]|uniref:Uncharacterized protein n=1 Tax=Methylobacterium symbioticum TaxID=2584084 RepID=A0A509EAC1_9HYPH|nr:hypothetical protein [Methylobacterium symbioticum]VUD70644.1 hypothetical protein MET9862_01216 [Methylobacterium symbioticum]